MDFLGAIRSLLGHEPVVRPERPPEAGRAEPIPTEPPPPPDMPGIDMVREGGGLKPHAIAFGKVRVLCWCGQWHRQQMP